MSTLARNECRELLRYNYTPDERREKGQQLADTHIRLGAVNEELDRVKAGYKARVSTLENEINSLSTQVSTGYEMREYVCFYEYDQPEKGKKTLRRKAASLRHRPRRRNDRSRPPDGHGQHRKAGR